MANERTTSWDAFYNWCKKWLPVIGGFVVIGAAILGGIKYIVKSEVSGIANDITAVKTTLQPLPESISSLKDRATKMETHWEDLKLREVSQKPTSKENVNAVKQSLDAARTAEVKPSLDAIKDAGDKLLLAGQKNPLAWDAAVAFLEYRTFINSGIVPFPLEPTINDTQYVYALRLKPNPVANQKGTVLAVRVKETPGEVPLADSARIESLIKPQSHGSGVRLLIVEGKSDIIVLDGEYFKNVIVRDAIVEYDGGPVRLENVYFINCTLRWHPSAPARDLGQQLLADASVTFAYPHS